MNTELTGADLEEIDRLVMDELMEEIDVEVDRESLKYLGAVENIFHFNGNVGHEIVLIYDGVLKESGLYEQAGIDGKEVDGESFRAVWKNIDEFGDGGSQAVFIRPLIEDRSADDQRLLVSKERHPASDVATPRFRLEAEGKSQ